VAELLMNVADIADSLFACCLYLNVVKTAVSFCHFRNVKVLELK